MLTAYLDDSGAHPESAVATLAGYVGSVSAWEDFEEAAVEILERYGIRVLHTVDLHGTKREFSGWSRIKKNCFAIELYDAADKLHIGLSFSAKKTTFNSGKITYKIAQNSSPFGFCLNRIIDWLLTDKRVKDDVWADGMSIVIESGSSNSGDFERVFHAVKREYNLENVLRSLSFVDKTSCMAIQLADYLAYYSRRYAEDLERTSGEPTPTPEPIGIASRKIPHLGHVATEFFP